MGRASAGDDVVVPGARGAAVEDETGVWRRWGVERAARASGTRGREAARRAGKKRVETGGGAPAIDWRDACVLWERRSFAARATSTANGRGTHDLAAMTRARASLLARLARFANHARERSRVRCSPSPSLAEGRGIAARRADATTLLELEAPRVASTRALVPVRDRVRFRAEERSRTTRAG